jgi:hypothetical protein
MPLSWPVVFTNIWGPVRGLGDSSHPGGGSCGVIGQIGLPDPTEFLAGARAQSLSASRRGLLPP